MSYLLDDLVAFEKEASLFNRYEGNAEVASAKADYQQRKRRSKNIPTFQNRKDAEVSNLKYRDAKTRADMAKQKKKSPKEEALAAKYRAKGFTPGEAELKAFRAYRAKKRLMIGAGAAAAVGAGVGAYKYYDYATDKTIKAGQTMQNIRSGDAQYFDKGDPYFIADREQDKAKYRHLYGAQLGDNNVRKANLEATQDIKIPSRKKTKQAFKEVINKDPENMKALKDSVDKLDGMFPGSTREAKMLRKAKKKLSKGKIDGTVYDAAQLQFTKGFRDSNPEFGNKVEKGLYESLKSKGYQGIRDRHDEKYSGYGAKAHILFDTKDRVKVKSDDALSKEEIMSKFIPTALKTVGADLAKSPKILGAAAAGASYRSLKSKLKEQEQEKKVETYRKNNPGSTLGYAEILGK